MAAQSPYAVLGLTPTASRDQVKETFRKLVWQYHPDKSPPSARAAEEVKFKEVSAGANITGQRHPITIVAHSRYNLWS